MLPSLLAREVQSGLKQFLTTGYEPSDPLFGGVMRRFAEDEARWMKGPYLQVGLPFRPGTAGRSFFGGFETAFPGFVHQEAAWQRLSSDRGAAPTLVATGTGSGKTECFLYPLLDHSARAIREGSRGIKALVIYPMNALATDQARRFAQVIARTPAFQGLRVGLFVGGRSGRDGRGQMTMSATGVITDRATLRKDPPDILLTNYKMLDYLLIRPKDRRLWSRNTPGTLRHVVVDELHTFDGAQGTDLALLLRRLKARLRVAEGQLVYVGTSATLGGNADTAPLREYARQIFGVEFPPESVVTERRITEQEFLGEHTIEHVLYPGQDFEKVLAPDLYASQEAAIAAWFHFFFPGEAQPLAAGDPAWRRRLGELLKKHLLFVNLLRLAKGQIVALADLQHLMQGPLPEGVRPHIGRVLDALLALVAWARDPDGRPFVTLRVQLWMRELRRMVANVHADPSEIALKSEAEVRRDSPGLHLPLVQCSDCHTTGWLSRLPHGTTVASKDLDEIYNAWFSGQPEVLRMYGRAGLTRPQCDGVVQRLCVACGNLQVAAGPCSACGHAVLVEVFRVTATRNNTHQASGVVHTWHDATCPACGSQRDPILLGARSATLGAVTVEQTWASPFNDDKKLIAFSDSVQDAAHRAGFFAARTYLNTVRTGLAKVIEEVARPTCAWPTFLERAGSLWLEEGSPLAMPVERFVSEFIGPNMTWQRDWAEVLQKEGRLPSGSRLPGRVRKRLAWQAFAEFTYLSRRGRTLEAIGKAVLGPSLDEVEAAALEWLPVLRERFGLRHLGAASVRHWLWGFLCRLRTRGAVVHPEMATFMEDGEIYAFAHKGGRGEWLPGIGLRAGQPRFLSLANQKDLDTLTHPRVRTFYAMWAQATLGAGGLFPEGAERELYLGAVEMLVRRGLLVQVEGRHGPVVGLNPERLVLDSRVARLMTEQGKRALMVAAADADRLMGMPCMDAPQEAYTRRVEGDTWLARQFTRGDLRRVYAAEHTGLLQREQREALEQRFKAVEPRPWHENLLSATPTLEMGVDIGDLSSVMLCSVPPSQASYLQRIGRAGRRDGNAFTTTLADGSSPHDGYFFEDTSEMLSGEVVPPGIFLKAPEVLRRQLFAFCLDDWVGSGIADTALPDKTKEALDARDSHALGQFPYTFLDHVRQHEDRLLAGFKALLGSDLEPRVSGRLDGFMRGTDQDDALKMRLSKLLDELSAERRSHAERAEQIKRRIQALKARPSDEALVDEIDQMERERQKALELVKEINQREWLNTLTDAGLIPNYAFPEAGVELKSLLWRKRSSDDPEGSGAYVSLPAERYERPAHSALSEFAPENVFYANQRRVEIDQVNLQLSAVETWRLCPACHHMRNLAVHPDGDGACPRCGDPMWSNVSQSRQLLRFRQAIANSDDTKVRIDDSAEDREPKFHVRQMLTDFDPSDIREAYRLRSAEVPFGFEFIERVVFRDVNFGESAKVGDAYRVAGRERARPGFKLCRHCGRIQRRLRNERERELGQLHSFDCLRRDTADPSNLIECLYLYREFTSEALRILMPYTSSGVDEVSVESFMAALRVGLKQRFGGKVDHLRILTQEEQGRDGAANRHYVLLYDSVPGGTGYLHELLADEARTMTEVFRLALKHIAACPCNASPEKDGCYRCVYQHRLGRAMSHVSRNRAREILDQLVAGLDQLERVPSVADIYVNPNFDSELEAKFIESLRRLSGKEGLPFIRLVQDIVQGKSGYLLELGEQRYWIEPQVELGPADGVGATCKPDFVLWPAQGTSPRRPIAVFCDGWAYHQDSAREDARKRNALVASGRFWVWAVTWEDVQAAMGEKAGTDLGECLPAMFFQGVPPQLEPMRNDRLLQSNAVAALVRWLAAPAAGARDGYAEQMARHAGVVAFQMLPNPRMPELEDARRTLAGFWRGLEPLPCERPSTAPADCGNVNDPACFVRYGLPGDLLKAHGSIPRSPGFVVLDESALAHETDRHRAWRRWLWLFNLFQALPGVLLATRAGLDAGDHREVRIQEPTLRTMGGGAASHAGGWEAVIDHSDPALQQGLRELREAGIPVPDEVGYELAEDEEVVAEAELAWTGRRLVVLMDRHREFQAAWETRGWRTIPAEGPWASLLQDCFIAGETPDAPTPSNSPS